jgi:hypothetical protein
LDDAELQLISDLKYIDEGAGKARKFYAQITVDKKTMKTFATSRMKNPTWDETFTL